MQGVHHTPVMTVHQKEALMRRSLATGLLILALALVPPAGAQTREETLIYSLQSDVDNWDPPNSVLREAIILGYHVYDHLAVRDLKTRRVVPNLATSWTNIDDTTWEVKLRQGVKFHDGTPFTARDVKATFDRVLDPTKKMTARGNHAKIKAVDIIDDHTVRFRTDGPYPLFVERLTAQVMQSDKVIREKGHEWMQEHPVGTGPYKLVKWNRKQEHQLVRNDDYWGPKPAFKHLRIRIIPEKATEIAELLSGGVDIIKAVPPDQMDVINKSGQARTGTSPILRTAMLQLDQAARSGPNLFTDRRVRQAANLAVDNDAIIKFVLNGLGDRVATGVNPMAFGWDPGLKPYTQDLAQAKKLLAEAGYPNGVDVLFNEGPPIVEPAIQQTNDAIIADMTKAGFRVKRNYIGDNTVLVARIKDGKARCSTGRGATTPSSMPTRSSSTSSSAARTTATTATPRSTTSSSRGAPRSTRRSAPRCTSRRRSCCSTTLRTSTSGGCGACGASPTGSSTRLRRTRSTACSS